MRKIAWVVALAASVAPATYTALSRSDSGGADLGPTGLVKWSKTVNGLAGRLVVSRARLGTSDSATITVELKNTSATPLAVQAGNPVALEWELTDEAGRVVRAASQRGEAMMVPQWAVLPGGAYMGFSACAAECERTAGTHLDTTTAAWKLKPGTYRLSARYGSQGFVEVPGYRQENVWSGELVLPPVRIEIVRDLRRARAPLPGAEVLDEPSF